MAKKHKTRRKASAEGKLPTFDDSMYDNVRYSMTFEYGEVGLTRASELLAPRARGFILAASFVFLVILIILALTMQDNYPLLILVFVIAFCLLQAFSNISFLRLNYVRASTIDPDLYDGIIHVVVDEDTVHVRDTRDVGEDYALADLKHVSANADGILARFGRRRYVFIPRGALSEGRYRSLGQLLLDTAAKNG